MDLCNATVESDRDGVIDALLRLLEGIDRCDEALLTSAFTEDAVFDLSGIDPSVGTFEPYTGRATIVERLLGAVGQMDTMHAATNIRVWIDGDTARLTCSMIGQHFRPGQGPSLIFADHLMLGNLFDTALVRDHDHVWRVERHTVRSSWSSGRGDIHQAWPPSPDRGS